MTFESELSLDLSGKDLKVVYAKQGDFETRKLYIMLYTDKTEFQIPETVQARIAWNKPDGNQVLNDCEVEGNRVIVNLTQQMLIKEGEANCELMLFNTGGLLTSSVFKAKIMPSAYEEDKIESSPEYNTFKNQIVNLEEVSAKANKALEEANAAVKEVTTLGEQLDNDERIRKDAETARNTQEISRQSAEALRASNEKTRQINETARQNDWQTKKNEINSKISDANNATISANNAADRANMAAKEIETLDVEELMNEVKTLSAEMQNVPSLYVAKTRKINNKPLTNDIVLSASDVGAASQSDIPVGKIDTYTGKYSVPSGFLLCDGRAISRTTYSQLYEVIGTNYGSGDGSTTFNIPDMQGKVPAGVKSSDTNFNSLAKQGGSTGYNLRALIGACDGNTSRLGYSVEDTVIGGYSRGIWAQGTSSYTGHINSINHTTAVLQPNNTKPTTLQPYLTVNYIIKY